MHIEVQSSHVKLYCGCVPSIIFSRLDQCFSTFSFVAQFYLQFVWVPTMRYCDKMTTDN